MHFSSLPCMLHAPFSRIPFWKAYTSLIIYQKNITIKSKGKVVPVLNKAPRHEGVLVEWRYSSTHSLTSALDGGEWSASRSGRFIPNEIAPSIHWIGGWVSPRAGLDTVEMISDITGPFSTHRTKNHRGTGSCPCFYEIWTFLLLR
jgi:hypothetical protein